MQKQCVNDTYNVLGKFLLCHGMQVLNLILANKTNTDTLNYNYFH